jgi:hypothetical protein
MSNMKNLDLNLLDVQEMNALEMNETDAEWVLLLCCLCVLLLASCQTQISIQVGGSNNGINNASQGADSTLNGNSLEVPLN